MKQDIFLVNELEIRKGLEKDIPYIADIHFKSFKHAYTNILNEDFLSKKTYEKYFELTKKRFEEKKSFTLVAIKEGILVGYCDFEDFHFHNSQDLSKNLKEFLQELNCKENDFKEHKLQEITSLYTDPNMLRQGIGKELLSSTLQILKKKGFKTVILWAYEKNVNACQFYIKNGGIPYNDKVITTMPDGTKHTEILFIFDLLSYK